MQIRAFEASDAKAVAELSNANGSAFQYPSVTPQFIIELSKRPGFAMFVSTGARKLAGFCGVDSSSPGVAELGPICVAKPYRRKGLGASLVKAAASAARAAGAGKLIIKVKASNKTGQSFFQRLGFKEAAGITLKCCGEPAVLMESACAAPFKTEDSRRKTGMDWKDLKTRKIEGKGLVIAVAQDAGTKSVLMVAYQDEAAFKKTRETGELWLYSTSKKRLWKKGEVSGNVMKVKDVSVDCDCDALLYRVQPAGPACHEGYVSCFYRDIDGKTRGKRLFDPKKVY